MTKNPKVKTIGILNSGGDCPGLNATIAALVRSGSKYGYKFIGFKRGLEGILNPPKTINLDESTIRGISHLGGTILHSTNKGRFSAKVGAGNVQRIPDEIIEQSISNLKKFNIDYLIIIGGDGTLNSALQLAEKGLPIIGIPKSIDNDINQTDYSIGYSTAVDNIFFSLDKVHSTVTSHDRILIVEIMGRHAGWLTLTSGLSNGAKVILIPEIPYNVSVIVDYLKYRKKIRQNSTIIAMAEGAIEKNSKKLIGKTIDNQEIRLRGASEYLEKRIEQEAPGEFDMRTLILGHIQRGGSPNVQDRILALRLGTGAIEAINRSEKSVMIAIQNEKVVTVPIQKAVNKLKLINPKSDIIKSAREINVCFGDTNPYI